MKKETFDLITGRLDEHLKSCGYYLDGIQRTENLRELTIVNAQLLKKFCKEEQSAMDQVVTSELYHLIGMGDLTPVQMSTLIYKVKDWLQYRTVIKVISSGLTSIDSLPTIPVTSTYKLSVLGSITLKSGVGPEVSDNEPITEKPAAEPTAESAAEPVNLEDDLKSQVKFDYRKNFRDGVAIGYDHSNVATLIRAIRTSKASNQAEGTLEDKLFINGCVIKNSTMQASVVTGSDKMFLYMTSDKRGRKFAGKLIQYLSDCNMLETQN